MKKVLVWTGAVFALALMLGLFPVMGVTDGPQDAAAQVRGAVVDETLYVVARFQSDTPNGITAFRSSTIVTMTNTDDRTCAYNLRWRDNDGTRVLCALPGTISSGETKVFCSRRLDDNGLLSTCDFTCGVDTPANEELIFGNEGIIFIDRETTSSKGCANNIVIDAAIYHTTLVPGMIPSKACTIPISLKRTKAIHATKATSSRSLHSYQLALICTYKLVDSE